MLMFNQFHSLRVLPRPLGMCSTSIGTIWYWLHFEQMWWLWTCHKCPRIHSSILSMTFHLLFYIFGKLHSPRVHPMLLECAQQVISPTRPTDTSINMVANFDQCINWNLVWLALLQEKWRIFTSLLWTNNLLTFHFLLLFLLSVPSPGVAKTQTSHLLNLIPRPKEPMI